MGHLGVDGHGVPPPSGVLVQLPQLTHRLHVLTGRHGPARREGKGGLSSVSGTLKLFMQTHKMLKKERYFLVFLPFFVCFFLSFLLLLLLLRRRRLKLSCFRRLFVLFFVLFVLLLLFFLRLKLNCLRICECTG